MNDAPKNFASFKLDSTLLAAVSALGFETPTPIQAEAIPILLEGRDVIGRARTGSGKTAAFGLPLLQSIDPSKNVQALILAPTRELAIQVSRALKELCGDHDARILSIYGGASYQPQLKALKRGVSIVVGTPGRVIDMMDRGALDVSGVEFFVLDEADEMLNMGFIDDIEKIMRRLPKQKQVALFSATMPGAIQKVAAKYLRKPVEVQVEDSALSVDHIDQTFMKVPSRKKSETLLRLLATQGAEGTLVFAKTRVRVAETAIKLVSEGIAADALHGDMDQRARERVLSALRSKKLDVLVATDVAARGLDVNHLTHVINFDLPQDAETYVHRIGRTGRAGREGTAVTLVEPREWGRSRNYARTVGVRFVDADVPTQRDVLQAQKDDLRDRLGAKILEPGRAEAVKWLVKLKDDNDWSIEDIAVAAIRLLEEEVGVELGAEVPESDDSDSDARANFDDLNECEVVIGRGRRDRLRAGDIVGVFTNELGVSADQIGRITLGSRETYVGLPRQVADRLVKKHPSALFRGKTAQISHNSKRSKRGKKG